MWIVRVTLNRPYTFVVLVLLILGIGPLTIARTPTDIFPNIDIPVVAAIWNNGGLSAQDMADRIVSNYERANPVAAVLLIKALGGGWDRTLLPGLAAGGTR
jgi:multidrug efflux pump subunit AcrB